MEVNKNMSCILAPYTAEILDMELYMAIFGFLTRTRHMAVDDYLKNRKIKTKQGSIKQVKSI